MKNYGTSVFWPLSVVALLSMASAKAATLHVGAASVSITPDKPVALSGQMHTRIARDVQSEVQANALAMESREGARTGPHRRTRGVVSEQMPASW